MNYVTIDEANTYFSERLFTESWDDADTTKRNKALAMSTKAIDRLNFKGEKTDEEQELQFPRYDDSEIPQDIKDACCELALKFLDGIDADMETDNIAITGNNFSGAHTTYDRSFAPEYVMAGIPSSTAWRLLLPYLRDTRTLSVNRVS